MLFRVLILFCLCILLFDKQGRCNQLLTIPQYEQAFRLMIQKYYATARGQGYSVSNNDNVHLNKIAQTVSNVHSSVNRNYDVVNYNLLEQSDCKCNQVQTRIVNGQNADLYPSAVVLQFYGRIFCSGFILNSKMIITAAHCLDKPISFARGMKIIAGVTKLSQATWRNEFAVEAWFNHPFYTFIGPFSYADVGVVILKNKIDFKSNPNIQPACIESLASRHYYLQRPLYAVGWGLLDRPVSVNGQRVYMADSRQNLGTNYQLNYHLPLKRVSARIDHLQEAQLYYVGPNNMASDPFFREKNRCARRDYVCVNSIKGAACNGDSGGPLHDSTRRKVIGVLSYGPVQSRRLINGNSATIGCDGRDVYTRIAYYDTFLKSITNFSNICWSSY